jgi:hypothetical protein
LYCISDVVADSGEVAAAGVSVVNIVLLLVAAVAFAMSPWLPVLLSCQ